jgi:hypothetical protein
MVVQRKVIRSHARIWKIRYHEGVPTEFDKATGGLRSLIILYDLLNEAYSREVRDLFTKGIHHRNLSVILKTQNLFHQGKHCRDISLNAKVSGSMGKRP